MTSPKNKKILVVDDEPDVRNFLAACLKDAGFNVETARDGMEAYEQIQAEEPDLITLDLVMPRKSGVQLLRNLHKNEKWSKIPVIVITAHADDEFGSKDVRELRILPDEYRPKYILEKPVAKEALIKAIGELLGIEISELEALSQGVDQERESIKKIIKSVDAETLQKIQELLKDKG